jgi:hypothetical protein
VREGEESEGGYSEGEERVREGEESEGGGRE